MAQPTIPIEIWAEEDYTLPNAQGPNKERPINDLWAKGYDFSQTPDVEAWNYIWNMQTAWLYYIENEEIPNLPNIYLQRDNNLSDLRDVETARKNLSVYSKSETDDRYLKLTGGTLTGPVKFSAGGATLDNVAGLKIGWNDSLSAGEANFVNNQGVGTGGFIFRNVNVDNSLETGRVTIQQDGTMVTTGGVTAANAATVGSLNVMNDLAVVSGKNIARSVNGVNADAAGNIALTIATTAASRGERGWFKDNTTGMIFQWGYGSWKVNDESAESITFPIAFPTTCLMAIAGIQIAGTTQRVDVWGQTRGWSRTSATFLNQTSGNDTWDVSTRILYWAIGY